MTKLKYPEMQEYSWAKELLAHEHKSRPLTGKPMEPAPINLLLTIIKDSASRPEVMAAYASAKVNEQVPPREVHLIQWFTQYMRMKYDYMMRDEYGLQTDAAFTSMIFMRRLANGEYTGIDDPRLHAELLADSFVSEEDGENYG